MFCAHIPTAVFLRQEFNSLNHCENYAM